MSATDEPLQQHSAECPSPLDLPELSPPPALSSSRWLSVAPTPAAALEPPRPLPNHRPAFVTETDERPWKDCLWASGAMLLDKWTNGDLTPTHQQLRRLAGDPHGGSTLEDLHVAYARLGINLRFSPDGGERITWSMLLRRLAKGAGAVLLGDDSKLPRWYGRWDYGFWKLTTKEKASKDNHAVYIERYDRRHRRVWLMDPLGRPGWKGEWISVCGAASIRVDHRWRGPDRGRHPIARAAPFARVAVSNPVISATSTTATAAFGIKAPRRWTFPGADVRVTFKPAGDPLLAAATSLPVTTIATANDGRPKKPVATVRGTSLRATTPLPSKAGAYRVTMKLTDRRFGRTVARAGNVTVFVPGPAAGRDQPLRPRRHHQRRQAGVADDRGCQHGHGTLDRGRPSGGRPGRTAGDP